MSMTYLDGEKIYYSFVSGANAVIKEKNHLNEINVFPVPDGDTGSNLASTMYAIIEDAKILKTAKHTMSSIADAVLTGARGNSGIIFAQYINGIFMSIKDDENLTLKSFAQYVRDAVPHAYGAISNPVEGTMITVIRAWADAVYGVKETAADFHEMLHKALEAAQGSLIETTAQLKVLEENNVVDSGAKGFVHFLEGFTEFVKSGKVSEFIKGHQEDVKIQDYAAHDDDNLEYRFCTEALISGENFDLQALKEELKDIGDSLIVAGNANKVRIHVHMNHPEDLFLKLRTKGRILQQKVDDMRRQYEAAHAQKYKIALVTDSIADLPQEYLDAHQIYMIPLNLVMDDTSYLDKVTMTADRFYDLLDGLETYPTTAQPSIKSVENLFSFLTTHYDEIIAITVSKEMSGTFNTVSQGAAKFLDEGKKIHIIDSRQNSGAEGLLVMKAAEEIAKGRSFEDIIRKVEALREETRILVSVNTLKYMVRSGRVKKVVGVLGKVMNLKPVISIDKEGKGEIAEKALSLRSNTKKIQTIAEKAHQKNPVTRYAIVHANDEKRAREYVSLFTGVFGKEPAYIMNISPIVGLSAGVGTVAVAYMSEGAE